MADSFSKKKENLTELRDNFFRRFDVERGISKSLNVQLAALGLIGLACNLTTWIVWLRFCFPENILGSFEWYVLKPFLVQEIIVAFGFLARYSLNSLVKKGGKFELLLNSIFGSFVYTSFFMVLIYFYREMPVFWLFAVCPMLLTSFYRDNTWFMCTLVCTSVEVIVVIMGFFEVPTYRIDNIPPVMMATEAVVIASLVGAFTVALHSRIEQVIRNVAKAEATQQAKSAFFANIGHELRSPINTLLGMDEMILREDINPEVENLALGIRDAGESLLSIVTNILDSSKLENGRLELSNEDYDLMVILMECYNLAILRASEKEISFKVVNESEVPRFLYGDSVRIRQIILNALSSAIKFTQVGFVELGLSYRKIDDENIKLIVRVSDTGVGIPESVQKNLFNSFERFNESDYPHEKGTGLGLGIAKQLVDLMGGLVKVESKLGEGTTLTFEIPQAVRGEAVLGDFNQAISLKVTNANKDKEKETFPYSHVLVVDDVELNIEVFKSLLRKTQVQVDCALSGMEALKYAKEKRYDVIFMDYLMPEMDGEKTLSEIRVGVNLNRNTPVVAIDADAGMEAAPDYQAMGFAGVVTKPFKAKEVEDTVYKVLKGLSGVRDLEESASSKPAETIVGFLDKIDFLDLGIGMSSCGNNEKQYKEMATDYLNNSFVARLNELFEENDWAEYKEAINELKSTSLSIGAVELSEEAKRLEICITNKDYDTVRIEHENLMRSYEEILSKLQLVLS